MEAKGGEMVMVGQGGTSRESPRVEMLIFNSLNLILWLFLPQFPLSGPKQGVNVEFGHRRGEIPPRPILWTQSTFAAGGCSPWILQ